MTKLFFKSLFLTLVGASAVFAQSTQDSDKLKSLADVLVELRELPLLLASDGAADSPNVMPKFFVTYDMLMAGATITASDPIHFGGKWLDGFQEELWGQKIDWDTLQNPHRDMPRRNNFDDIIVEAINLLEEMAELHGDVSDEAVGTGGTDGTGEHVEFCPPDLALLGGSTSQANGDKDAQSTIDATKLNGMLKKFNKLLASLDMAIVEDAEDQMARAVEMYFWHKIADYFGNLPPEPDLLNWLSTKFTAGTSITFVSALNEEKEEFTAESNLYTPRLAWESAENSIGTHKFFLNSQNAFELDQFSKTGIFEDILRERDELRTLISVLRQSAGAAIGESGSTDISDGTSADTSSKPACVPQLGGVWNKMNSVDGVYKERPKNCDERMILSHGEHANNASRLVVKGLIFKNTIKQAETDKLATVLANTIKQKVSSGLAAAAGCKDMVIFAVDGKLDDGLLTLNYADGMQLGRWVVNRDLAQTTETFLIKLENGKAKPETNAERHKRRQLVSCKLKNFKPKANATAAEMQALDLIKKNTTTANCR